MTTSETYADLGEAAWRWVLDQIRWDDEGPWIPESVPHDGGPPEDRDGMHSGIGGLAHVLEDEDVVQILKDKAGVATDGRGRFKSQASGPARIADREKKAPLKS